MLLLSLLSAAPRTHTIIQDDILALRAQECELREQEERLLSNLCHSAGEWAPPGGLISIGRRRRAKARAVLAGATAAADSRLETPLVARGTAEDGEGGGRGGGRGSRGGRGGRGGRGSNRAGNRVSEPHGRKRSASVSGLGYGHYGRDGWPSTLGGTGFGGAGRRVRRRGGLGWLSPTAGGFGPRSPSSPFSYSPSQAPGGGYGGAIRRSRGGLSSPLASPVTARGGAKEAVTRPKAVDICVATHLRHGTSTVQRFGTEMLGNLVPR